MRYFTLAILIISSFSLQAQSFDEDINIHHEVPGYIITNDGDTIKGKIKVQTRSKNQAKVKFINNRGKSKTYKPKHLIGYGYQTKENNNAKQIVYKERHFLRKTADRPPVPFSSKTVFMEVKASGKAILYSYYVQNNENVDNKYLHYYYLDFKDGSRERKITQDDFDWAVPAFLEDCKKISGLVGTRMGFDNLEELVDIYNNCDYQGIENCDVCTEEIKKEQEEAQKKHSNK
ncbi:MAG: hypothetical protein ACPG19_13000 [Saprospiraceae bacterium]